MNIPSPLTRRGRAATLKPTATPSSPMSGINGATSPTVTPNKPKSPATQKPAYTPEDEKNRLLDLAGHLREQAGELHDKAEDMFESDHELLGEHLNDRADALEQRARELDEEADDVGKPPEGAIVLPRPPGSAFVPSTNGPPGAR